MPAYTYDPVGNRTSKTLGSSTSYAYDRADRITSTGATSITVDAVGNLTARGSDTFNYDGANRLASATVAGTTETYTYDGDGVRFSRQVGGGPVIRYVTDPSGSLPVTIADGARRYIWDLGLAYAVAGSSLEVYHTDRLGSIRAISDASGAVTATYRTDEWGVPTATSGSSSQPYGFTGEPVDATGLVYLRARYYDPSLGRFITRDPWSGSIGAPQTLDRYPYAGNSPATYSDPSGQCIQFIFASSVGGPAVLAGIAVSGICFVVVAATTVAAGVMAHVVANDNRIDIPGIPAPPPATGTLSEPVPPPAPLRPPEGFRCPPGVTCRMIAVLGAGGLVTFYYVYQAANSAGYPQPEPGPPPEPLPSPKSRVLSK